MQTTRRHFLKSTTLLGATSLIQPWAVAARISGASIHLATNQYPWGEFYRREGRNFLESLDPGLSEIAAAGLQGYEPLVESVEDLSRLSPLLEKHGLKMSSLYVNSSLHEPELVGTSTEEILRIADSARKMGTRIIVTNPSPIQWGGPQNKDDRQLDVQADALDQLGRKLRELGLKLAYHNHDSELRMAAREFHHMMAGTDPEVVHLCLDAHWIYRGSGDSSLALFDIVKLYGSRVIELHIRQSQNGTWTESLQDGDIDYRRLAEHLARLPEKPHLVLEQAVESASPHTMNALEAHKRSVTYVRDVFRRWAE